MRDKRFHDLAVNKLANFLFPVILCVYLNTHINLHADYACYTFYKYCNLYANTM